MDWSTILLYMIFGSIVVGICVLMLRALLVAWANRGGR